MRNFKVLVGGGVEGLEFSDMLIEKNGSSRTVKVKKGDLLPVKEINKDALERSLKDGCLSRSINAGWVIQVEGGGEDIKIVEKTDDEKLEEFKKKDAESSQRVEETSRMTPEEMAQTYVRNEPHVIVVSDGSKVVDNSKKEVAPYEEFNKLKHFEKLSFINKNNDVGLLEEISQKSNSKQIKSVAIKRLEGLKTGG